MREREAGTKRVTCSGVARGKSLTSDRCTAPVSSCVLPPFLPAVTSWQLTDICGARTFNYRVDATFGLMVTAATGSWLQPCNRATSQPVTQSVSQPARALGPSVRRGSKTRTWLRTRTRWPRRQCRPLLHPQRCRMKMTFCQSAKCAFSQCALNRVNLMNYIHFSETKEKLFEIRKNKQVFSNLPTLKILYIKGVYYLCAVFSKA